MNKIKIEMTTAEFVNFTNAFSMLKGVLYTMDISSNVSLHQGIEEVDNFITNITPDELKDEG